MNGHVSTDTVDMPEKLGLIESEVIDTVSRHFSLAGIVVLIGWCSSAWDSQLHSHV